MTPQGRQKRRERVQNALKDGKWTASGELQEFPAGRTCVICGRTIFHGYVLENCSAVQFAGSTCIIASLAFLVKR